MFNNDNDFELIRELYRLSDRYDVSRFKHRITGHLFNMYFDLFFAYKCVSDEDFENKWLIIGTIARIAFESRVLRLIKKVMAFIRNNFDHFLKKDIKELNQLNDLTDGRLFKLMAKKCRIGEKSSKQLNALKDSVSQVRRYVCEDCNTSNPVQSIDLCETKCKDCNRLFCEQFN